MLKHRFPIDLMSDVLHSWLVVLTLSILASVGIFMAFLYCTGHAAAAVMRTLLTEGWNSRFAISETMVKAPPIMMCALAAALPGRLQLLNIGGEGQLIVGSLAAAWAASVFGTPFLMVSAAVVAGCMWAAVPGALRAYLNVNETVVSLMLNYVAAFLLLYLIHGIWQDPATPGWPQGEPLPESARLSPLIAGTRINLLLPIAVMACLLTGLLFHFSVVGPTWRILAENPKTARMLAISPSKHILIAFCVGGSLAAIAGFAELTAINLRLREGISLNYGYAGLLVSWIARHNPFVIPIVAFAMAGVVTGADALQINAGLPLSTVQILIGLLLLGTLLAEAVYKRTNGQWAEAGRHVN